ncbi:MAG: KamA family radical SAM protein [Bryobacterales bacterium]
MNQARKKPKYLTKLDQIPQLTKSERERLQPVAEKFVFRTNDYYQKLIDWSDPNDPIRALVVPVESELEDWGRLDASFEEIFTPVPGVEHKYKDTALLLVNDVCGAYCRYCFRKRLFMDDNDEVVRDVSGGLDYIREHTEISNVLLTGGDPLIMSTSKLEPVIRRLREIPHVQIIRIGSKMPAFNPFRIIDDPSLLKMIETYSTPEKRIYIMAHFNHPRELTDESQQGIDLLLRSGAIVVNQSPLIRGINDDAGTLARLFAKLSFIGVPPYYIFQCRPTEGNKAYSVPIEEAYQIFLDAQSRVSGLARRARFSMSHRSGKIEAAAMTGDQIVFKYHRAADEQDTGRVMIFKRNPRAHWFNDYAEAQEFLPSSNRASDFVAIQPMVSTC